MLHLAFLHDADQAFMLGVGTLFAPGLLDALRVGQAVSEQKLPVAARVHRVHLGRTASGVPVDKRHRLEGGSQLFKRKLSDSLRGRACLP